MARGFGAAETKGLSRTAFQKNYNKALSMFSKTLAGLGYTKAEARQAAAEHIRTLDKDSLRAMGLLPKEEPAQAAQPAGFGAAEGGRNAEYDKELEKIPLHKWTEAKDFYDERVSEVQSALDEFDDSLQAAEKALANPNFDWEDKYRVADIVPVPAPDALDGMDGSDYMERRFEDEAHSDYSFDEAASADRDYEEENNGEPASLRGNSEVDRLRGEWAKGVVKEIVENAKLLRSGYVNGLSPKLILDEFRRTNNIRDRDGKLPD